MNSYAALVFAAIILAVQGGSLRVARQTGGWSAPLPPQPSVLIDVELAADGAAIGSGVADASQETLATADGTPENLALIDLVAGTQADVDQEVIIDQIGIIDLPSLSSSSLNLVSAGNIALATDQLLASITGGLGATLTNVGADNVSGEGAIATNASSSNTEIIS